MHLIKDENGNLIPHGHEHVHEHTHEDGHTHTHAHTHEHGHEEEHHHHHDHDHGCEGSCDTGCNGCGGAAKEDPKAQLVALLGYMLDHNESHARSLTIWLPRSQRLVCLKRQSRSKRCCRVPEGQYVSEPCPFHGERGQITAGSRWR